MKKLLLLFAVLVTAISVSAENYILYTSSDGQVVSSTASNLFGANIVSNTYENGQGKIVFDGEVTKIGIQAFLSRKTLTSIVIPSSVTSIGQSAFNGCSSLSSINIPNSVTNIGTNAFRACESLTKVEITDIAAWCKISFSNYSSNPLYFARHLYLKGQLVTDLVIPNTVTEIKDWVFRNCSSITSVVLPSSVTKIGNDAFSDCSNLKSIEIPYFVKTIGEYAFRSCSSLKEIEIPKSVTTIGKFAFSGCSGLTSAKIPDSVTMISEGLFQECSSLTSVEIPNSVTSIGKNAFTKCSNLTSAKIGNNVTSLGTDVFSYCFHLKSIDIPNSVVTIGDNALYYCPELTSVKIGNSVTSIGKNAFAHCPSLTEITSLNTTPPSVGKDCFYNVPVANCVLNVPEEAIEAYKDADDWKYFTNIVGIVTPTSNFIFYTSTDGKVVNPNEFDESGNNVEFGANIVSNTYENGQGKIVFDGEVTKIGRDAFCECTTLKSIEIPNSVTEIGYNAFASSGLTSVALPLSVSQIPDCAFQFCTSLTSVEIPNSVTKIGEGAFFMCTELPSVTIPSSVSKIGDFAFGGCLNLKAFYGKFASEDNLCLIVDDRLIAVAPAAGLTSFTIPNTIREICEWALAGCWTLTSVEIPNSVAKIQENAFRSCIGLTSVKIPDSVTEIDDYAFAECKSLALVEIGCSVKEMESQVFRNCSSLKEIFMYTTTPPSLRYDTFYELNLDDCTLYVPRNCKEVYADTEYWNEFTNIVEFDTDPDTNINSMPNAFYTSNPSGFAGKTINLKVCMKNESEATSYQFNLYLPEGVTVAVDPDDEESYLMEITGSRTTAKKHNALDGSYAKDGSFLVTCASTSNAKFSGNDGEVLTITLNVADNMEPGEYPICFKQCVITEAGTNQSIYPEDVKQTLVIKDFITGDANGDGVINISDFSAIISHIHGEDPANANVKAMDVNGDGTVNISDASSIITLIHE